MDVRVDAPACEYVAARGGVLWVRSTRSYKCRGATTLLRATTRRPKDAKSYGSLDCELPISIFFRTTAGRPERLDVKLRGLIRKHPVALWDGCAFKV